MWSSCSSSVLPQSVQNGCRRRARRESCTCSQPVSVARRASLPRATISTDDRAILQYAAVPWRPCDPSQQHRVRSNVIVPLRLQAHIRDDVDLSAKDLLNQFLEPDELERRSLSRRVQEHFRMNALEVGRVPKLLANGRLRDSQRMSNLSLTHPRRVPRPVPSGTLGLLRTTCGPLALNRPLNSANAPIHTLKRNSTTSPSAMT